MKYYFAEFPELLPILICVSGEEKRMWIEKRIKPEKKVNIIYKETNNYSYFPSGKSRNFLNQETYLDDSVNKIIAYCGFTGSLGMCRPVACAGLLSAVASKSCLVISRHR